MPRRLLIIAAFLLSVAVVMGGVWWVTYVNALGQVADRGRADLGSASERLVGQLQRFRQVAVQLADHPALLALEAEPTRRLLLSTADQSGSLDISFINAQGRIEASSNPSLIGVNKAADAEFSRAMTGALGTANGLTEGGLRAFSFAAPVFDNARPVGAVLVRVAVEAVEESDWRGAAEAVFYSDQTGRVFVTNRSELLMRDRNAVPFLGHSARRLRGYDIWSLSAGRYLPHRALHLVEPLPVIGMTGEALVDTAPAERIAGLQAAVAGALCLAFGALLILATERRRTLADTNQKLEARVAERTAALVRVNDSLRVEVRERQEAEAALKKAQDDLVQAGKLSALGQMSAGISHELNQPLMAIRSFAENGVVFLDRQKPEAAAQNMARIGELARRMGRIIKNLRAFAKQEHEPIADVDIAQVVEAVLELAAPRIHAEEVVLIWQPPAERVMVRGGEVRLQQVVMNLVSNALDAMAGQDDRRLEISLDSTASEILLSVHDNGPGLADKEKIFDPFYSTKEVGQSEGMGLGLSISYGLVQSFGGAIRGQNHAKGGAVFTVTLQRSGVEAAA